MVASVPTVSILCMGITFLICFGLPAFLWIWVAKGRPGISLAVAAGTLGFILPQVVVRLPILSLLQTTSWMGAFAQGYPLLYALALAFSAGLFETAGRYGVFRWFLKGGPSREQALAAGVGHGGSEAILLVGTTYLNNLILSFLINVGRLPSTIPSAEVLTALLVETPWFLYLLAGWERVCTIVFHLALNMVLWRFWSKSRRGTGFWICVGLHTLLDFAVATLQLIWGLWATYLFLTGMLAAGIVYLYQGKKRMA